MQQSFTVSLPLLTATSEFGLQKGKLSSVVLYTLSPYHTNSTKGAARCLKFSILVDCGQYLLMCETTPQTGQLTHLSFHE